MKFFRILELSTSLQGFNPHISLALQLFEEGRRCYGARRQPYYARLKFSAAYSLLKMFGRLPNFIIEKYTATSNFAM
jgi:hypothetical protein